MRLELVPEYPVVGVIYKLVDPRSGAIRYIGKTTGQLQKRLNHHICEAKRRTDRKARWIASLLEIGLRPTIEPIFTWGKQHASAWGTFETNFIREFRKMGHDLTNGSDGGRGGVRPSPEVRAKISAAKRNPPAHVREAVAKANRERTPEQRAKQAEKLRLHRHTAEARAKMSKSHLGRIWTPEHKANHAAAVRRENARRAAVRKGR